MNHKFLLLFLVCINSIFHCVPRVLGSPIIGGSVYDRHIFKYHVSLHRININTKLYEYICGGTIINEKHILTAASCFTLTMRDMGPNIDTLVGKPKIIAGTNRRERREIEEYIVAVFIPRSYVYLPVVHGDIAVAQLKRSLDLRRYNKKLETMNFGQLPDNEEGTPARFCGFGYYKREILENGQTAIIKDFSNVVRYLDVNLIYEKKCPSSQICAIASDTSNSGCIGDAGAGLIFDDKIVGVYSHSSRLCDTKTSPMVFTRLSIFMNEIYLAMEGKADHTKMYVFRLPSALAESSSHQSPVHQSSSYETEIQPASSYETEIQPASSYETEIQPASSHESPIHEASPYESPIHEASPYESPIHEARPSRPHNEESSGSKKKGKLLPKWLSRRDKNKS